MNLTRQQYEKIIALTLALFSLSIALSKSASNILMVLVYLAVLYPFLYDKSFRNSIITNFRQPLLVPIGLYLTIAVIGLFFTSRLSSGFGIINKFTSFLLIYLMVSVLLEFFDNRKKAYNITEEILKTFLIGIFVLDVIGFFSYLGVIGNKKFVLPLAPLNVHHIWFSNVNAVGIYCAVSVWLFSQRTKTVGSKIFLSLFLLVAVCSILMSLSRTAWLGMIVTTVIMSYIVFRKLKKTKAFAIAAVTIIICCFLLYNLPMVNNRIELIYSDISQFTTGQTGTSLGARFLMWKAAIQMFLSNPVFGVGTGDYVSTMKAYITLGKFPEFLAMFNQPHNIYLFALATNGLPGLLALLMIFYFVLKYSIPILTFSDTPQNLLAFLAVATAVHFMVAGLTDSLFNIQSLRYTFAFVMGICMRRSVITARSKGRAAHHQR